MPNYNWPVFPASENTTNFEAVARGALEVWRQNVADMTQFLTTVFATAGEDIPNRRLVFIAAPANGLVSGRAYLADASDQLKSTGAFMAGITLASGTSGGQVSVQCAGVVSGFAGLLVGRPVYVGAVGNITQSSAGISFLRPVGVALSASEILIAIDHSVETAETRYNKGYRVGGTGASSCDKLNYDIDLTTRLPYVLSSVRGELSGAACADKGYAIGGNCAGLYVDTADKITFATDITAAVPSARFTTPSSGSVPLASDIAGYFSGGRSGVTSYLSTTQRVLFATDVTSVLPSSGMLLAAKAYGAGISSPENGYVIAGYSNAHGGFVTADKISFATDIMAAQVSANVPWAVYYGAGISAPEKGFLICGFYTGVGGVSYVCKMPYITEVMAYQASSNLALSVFGMAALSAPTCGYVMGGINGGGLTQALYYETEITIIMSSANLPESIGYCAGISGYNNASK